MLGLNVGFRVSNDNSNNNNIYTTNCINNINNNNNNININNNSNNSLCKIFKTKRLNLQLRNRVYSTNY